ncbi:MAG: MotA/TolQ/ExbB proton channel family protein [Gammaproteobacteria bacterium]|uniref:MotA/TolQ/ExbB proton channel family protein n=1 Tax=SAR86 cluster bacterium TaxID=2030880 RepID=A0A368BMP2_9GAMM|nr:MAG: MotA/TolQ/ExbB proton channel family protein [SAR86 cluster bacterium]|tara:strand:+ start:65 stop:667 length:603 start_codon:yes stop_codon:yes gene_type:complete
MNNILISGGWFIWPLLVCSILLISIVLERLWFLQRRLVAPKGLLRQVQNLIQKDSFHSQNQDEIALSSQLGDLLTHCYQYHPNSRDFLEVKAEEKASEIKLLLERNLSMLSTIASISPLLGLLGTVVGMIKVFSNIDINGSANTDLLAAGISEALITTAFGLIIAVPAIIFYRYFEQKTVILMSILQANTSIFLDFIYKK